MFNFLRGLFALGSKLPSELPCCCPEPSRDCPCSAVPEHLTAVFNSAGSGSEAAVIDVDKISDYVWTGSGNVGETSFDFVLTCDEDGVGGDDNIGPTMSATIDCGSGPITITQTASLCDPFEWTGAFSGCDLESVTVTQDF